jgi:phenylalanyl-tRNA synthetase beta chain
MLELGIPLHIFDRQKIKGDTVYIKRVGTEDKFTTLDEIERQLIPSDTVICDSEKPLVLAGIMGGLNSGVDQSTTEIFIEVANWKAAEVRRTSTRLGLRTDSSQRYEKSLDSLSCERTLLRTLEMVLKFCPEAKVVGQIEYDGEDLSSIETKTFELESDRIRSTLGKEVSNDEIIRILKGLEFGVREECGRLSLEVPSFRATKDIECDADIIEEIGRIVGYDHIEPSSPLLAVTPIRLTEAHQLRRKLQDFMVYHGRAFEVHTYPMVGVKLLQKANWKGNAEELKLINSLSNDHDRMRPSMIPSLLEIASNNAKHEDRYRLFEMGRSYIPDGKFASERHQMAVMFYNREQSVYLDLVNTMERAMKNCLIPFDFCDRHPKFKNDVVDESWAGVHPFEFQNIRIMGKMQGVVFTLHPLIARQFKIKGHLSIGIIDLTNFHQRPLKSKMKYKPLPKFPNSTFDYTVALEKDRAIKDIFEVLKKVKIKEIQKHSVVDLYTPGKEEKKFVTMRTVLADNEKTLSGEFLKGAESQIISALEKAGIPLKDG